VSRFDRSFGFIMSELKAAGREADTVVVFMSDHGMSFPLGAVPPAVPIMQPF
jgi:arylsulfatase A-like enzyme